MFLGFFLYPEKLLVKDAGPVPKLNGRRRMLADGERLGTQGGGIQFFGRNSIKKFLNRFYFHSVFIFAKKYFEN